jgi:hypothetical protein
MLLTSDARTSKWTKSGGLLARSKRAYAWSPREGPDDTGERFMAVLEIPPVERPVTAVRASIMSDAKKGKINEF